MNNRSAKKRGSMLITSIIVTAVTAILLSSLIQYSNNINRSVHRESLRELAFHLAESGIEIGINDLNTNIVTGDFWKRENLNYQIGTYFAELDLAVIQDSSDDRYYDIYSVVSIPMGGDSISRSVTVRIKNDLGTTTSTTDNGGSNQLFPYSIIVRQQANIQHGNNDKRVSIASYDSNITSDPVYGVDSGFASSVVVVNPADDAISVNNAIIDGVLNSPGGSIRYSSGRTNSNQIDQNLWLRLDANDLYSGINTEGIRSNFNGTINDPTYPDTSGYLKPDGQSNVTANEFWKANSNAITFGVSQNFWQNGSDANSTELINSSGNTRSIGQSGEQSTLTTPTINLQKGSKLVVKGDVVLYVQKNFNISGDIQFENDASLHLIASQNNHFTGSSDNPKPAQFRVTPYVDLESNSPSGPNVQFNNTDRIAVVINAPYSKVSTGGQGNGNFDYMGAIVANNFESPNGVRFFYDIDLQREGEATGGSSTSTETDPDDSYRVISWRETYVAEVLTLLRSLGVDV